MELNDQVIGVLDCGMVGRVDDDLRQQIEDLLLAAIDHDAGRLLDSVVRIGQVPADFDRDELKSELHFSMISTHRNLLTNLMSVAP